MKSQDLKTNFHFAKKVINGLILWFLYLLGILHHTTVNRKGISVDAILSATHTLDYLISMCKMNVSTNEDFPMSLQLQELLG